MQGDAIRLEGATRIRFIDVPLLALSVSSWAPAVEAAPAQTTQAQQPSQAKSAQTAHAEAGPQTKTEEQLDWPAAWH